MNKNSKPTVSKTECWRKHTAVQNFKRNTVRARYTRLSRLKISYYFLVSSIIHGIKKSLASVENSFNGLKNPSYTFDGHYGSGKDLWDYQESRQEAWEDPSKHDRLGSLCETVHSYYVFCSLQRKVTGLTDTTCI